MRARQGWCLHPIHPFKTADLSCKGVPAGQQYTSKDNRPTIIPFNWLSDRSSATSGVLFDQTGRLPSSCTYSIQKLTGTHWHCIVKGVHT